MLNEVVDLSVEHVLMFVIIAFLLYHLVGGCSCGNGFSVGVQNFVDRCNAYDNKEDECKHNSGGSLDCTWNEPLQKCYSKLEIPSIYSQKIVGSLSCVLDNYSKTYNRSLKYY